MLLQELTPTAGWKWAYGPSPDKDPNQHSYRARGGSLPGPNEDDPYNVYQITIGSKDKKHWNIEIHYEDGNDELRKTGIIPASPSGAGQHSLRIAAFVQDVVRSFLNSDAGKKAESITWKSITDKQKSYKSGKQIDPRTNRIIQNMMTKIAKSREGWSSHKKNDTTFIASGPPDSVKPSNVEGKELEKRKRTGMNKRAADEREEKLNKKIKDVKKSAVRARRIKRLGKKDEKDNSSE